MFDGIFSKIRNFDPFGWRNKTESVFNVDSYDLSDFAGAKDQIPPLQQASGKWDDGDAWEAGRPVQDLFMAMSKTRPTFDQDMKDGLKPLASIMEQAMNMPEFAKLKAGVKGNSLAAGIGAAALVDKAMELVPDEAKEQAKKAAKAQNKADKAKEQAESLQAMLDLLGGQEQAESEQAQGLAEQIEQLTNQAQTAQAEALAASGQFQETMQGQQAQFLAGLNQAIGETTKEAKDKTEFIKAFGLAAGYNPQEIDSKLIEAAMKLFDGKDFSDFADLIGWANSSVTSAVRNSLSGRNDKVKTRNSALNPSKMTYPEKLAAMGVKGDASQDDWQNRALGNKVRHIVQDQGKKENEVAKGDIVIVRDDSGSTTGSVHSLFVSLEWALLKAAKLENRGFFSIPFSGNNQYHTWTPPKTGEKNIDSLLSHLKLNYGGGTEPYKPLLAALDKIQAESLKADIVILTDASFAPPSPEFLAKLDEIKSIVDIRIFAVVVTPGRQESGFELSFADETLQLTSLAQKGKIRELLGNLL